MAQLVKLPSGTIINTEHIQSVERLRLKDGEYLSIAMSDGSGKMRLVDDPDMLALWRYLCGHSDEAR